MGKESGKKDRRVAKKGSLRTLRDISTAFKVNRNTVTNWKAAGAPIYEDNSADPEEIQKWLVTYRITKKRNHSGAHKRKNGVLPVGETFGLPVIDGVQDTNDYSGLVTKENFMLKRAQRIGKELDLEKIAGRLVTSESVRDSLGLMSSVIVSDLTQFPRRVAPLVAGLEAEKITEVLDVEVRRLCDALQKTFRDKIVFKTIEVKVAEDVTEGN